VKDLSFFSIQNCFIEDRGKKNKEQGNTKNKGILGTGNKGRKEQGIFGNKGRKEQGDFGNREQGIFGNMGF
jgi:hypothetical protein